MRYQMFLEISKLNLVISEIRNNIIKIDNEKGEHYEDMQ